MDLSSHHMSAPQGHLSKQQGQTLLYVQGTPFEMGFQHGSLLRNEILTNIQTYLRKNPDTPSKPTGDRVQHFLSTIPQILPFIPAKYLEEMQGMATGAQVPFQDILLLNLFPEMFHCCGVTVSHDASCDDSLYHVRVLDYSIGKGLQSSAVLVMAYPQQGIPFLNITYAGFIGSVTGMNHTGIAIGEIGGQGYGNWLGMPMSFLLRSILEEASSLEEAKHLLTSTPRTCEYYYIISDGKTQDSFACYATHDSIQFFSPGEEYSVLSSTFSQPKHTLLVTGVSRPERYPVLLERISSHFGTLNAHTLMEIIQKPVSLDSNLHNAIFHPASLSLWIAHADTEGNPACDQPYASFSWEELEALLSPAKARG